MNTRVFSAALLPLLTIVSTAGKAEEPLKLKLSDFLVDIGAAPVSAGSITGLSASSITNVQTTQDLVLAINPFSRDDSKSGYGLAITPARTAITPMSGRTYLSSPLMRLIGSTTLSYAENKATIGNVAYVKQAYSIDTAIYLNEADDPIRINYDAFLNCEERKSNELKATNALLRPPSAPETPEEAQKKNKEDFDKFMAAATAADKACKASATTKSKLKWNASKVAASYAQGEIKPATGAGAKVSLGKFFTLGATYAVNEKTAAILSYRRTRDAADPNTLAGTVVFKSSNLAALRFTMNPGDKDDLRWMAEISNAKAGATNAAEASTFKHALGIDKKVMEGLWLEFRVGRSLKSTGDDTETKSLLSVNWSPSSTLFAK